LHELNDFEELGFTPQGGNARAQPGTRAGLRLLVFRGVAK
jgi:hypothetical protein